MGGKEGEEHVKPIGVKASKWVKKTKVEGVGGRTTLEEMTFLQQENMLQLMDFYTCISSFICGDSHSKCVKTCFIRVFCSNLASLRELNRRETEQKQRDLYIKKEREKNRDAPKRQRKEERQGVGSRKTLEKMIFLQQKTYFY